jgi:hypothetical protein
VPRFLRPDFGVEELLRQLAFTAGYEGDPIDADDYGVDVLAELGGRNVLPLLKRLRNHAGIQMENNVDRAMRTYGLE